MNILVADNNTATCEKVRHLLEKNIKGIHIIISQDNARDILEKIEECLPALIIMGVNLTGLNGLEVVKHLRYVGNAAEVILISGYKHFEFIREAMKAGVYDYILTSNIEIQLVESAAKALETYEKRLKKGAAIEEIEQTMEEARRHVEYSLIYSALFNGEASEEIKNYKKMFGLEDKGYILNVEIDSFESDSLINLKKDDVHINNYLRQIVSEHNKCIIGPRTLNRILIWIDSSENGRRKPDSQMADIKLAAHIIIGLKEKFLINVSIGIGGEKSIFNLHSSYEEAVRCLRYKGKHNIMRIRDIERDEVSREKYNDIETRLLKSIKFGKAEIINLFVEYLDQIRCLEEDVERNKIYEILVLASHEARLAGQNEIDFIDIKMFFDEIWKLPMEKIERWAYRRFEFIINSVQTSRMEIRSDAVNSAIRYMEEHYMEEITLEELARYIGISPQHFSKIFKDDIGLNYIEWLTRLRIDVAKRLLSEGGLSVKEVCYLVGYNDPNYFSRIFRKTEGVSPSSYAKENTPDAAGSKG